MTFAICVPAWNSLPYLRLMHEGIKRNSAFEHKLYIADNASTDGTKEWLQSEGIEHVTLTTNHGFCGVNAALTLAQRHDHVMVFNADMVPLHNWDLPIVQQIKRFGQANVKQFTISSRLVEPNTGNPEYAQIDFGRAPDTFQFSKLCEARVPHAGNTVQYSHPILFPTQLLLNVGMFDMTYWPGWSSDHDIAKACHMVGCRNFVMLGNSHVYHFSSATFKQLSAEDRAKDGQQLFFQKWHQSVDDFRREINVRQPFQRIHGT